MHKAQGYSKVTVRAKVQTDVVDRMDNRRQQRNKLLRKGNIILLMLHILYESSLISPFDSEIH